MVLERVAVQVAIDRHVGTELGVAVLELEMLANRLGEAGLGVDGKEVVLIHVGPLRRTSLANRLQSTHLLAGRDVCEDVPVPLAALTVLLYFVRRVKPTTVALLAYKTWRSLPPEQRRQVLRAAGRGGPRVASLLIRRGRV
jgi:hypothetical protein